MELDECWRLNYKLKNQGVTWGERKVKISKEMGADWKLSQGREKDAQAEAYLLTSSPRASHDSSVSLKPNFSPSSLGSEFKHISKVIRTLQPETKPFLLWVSSSSQAFPVSLQGSLRSHKWVEGELACSTFSSDSAVKGSEVTLPTSHSPNSSVIP